MQRVHFQVRVAVFNRQQVLTKISFVIFDIVVKKKSNVVKRGLCFYRQGYGSSQRPKFVVKQCCENLIVVLIYSCMST